MSRFPKSILLAAGLALVSANVAAAQDADAGENVFRKCKACHAVGEGAANRVGPQLNDLFGRVAGSLDGFKYSGAMVDAGEGGLVWTEETIAEYLADPRGYIPKNRMAFAGLKSEEDRADVIAYLKRFSGEPAESPAEEAAAEPEAGNDETMKQASAAPAAPAADRPIPEHGNFHLGRKALPEEVAAWDIDIRPDGNGLPEGRGTVAEGEPLYTDNCAVCHGDFGEGIDRWPVLAGGQDTLTDDRPVKTIGSYWPYLSTVYDYVRRAMPFGNARSLSDDDVYAITAYLLYLNDVVLEEDFELSHENFADITLTNEPNFIPDNRADEQHYADRNEPCMSDCEAGEAKVKMRARVLDVTPDTVDDDEGGGSID